jgi:glycine/D-amino acid oxidase-like deaminating enzyme
MNLDRRSFLRIAAAHAGLSAVRPRPIESAPMTSSPALQLPTSDVVVIGAGAFGGWTALYLREMGLRVTLVDMYGPGNSRATSGDETRGIRTAYGDREQWTRLAHEAIKRWRTFDETWGRDLRMNLFFPTGDLILRARWDNFLAQSKAVHDRVGVRNEVLTIDEVNYRWPWINTEGFETAYFEFDAGVGRARRSCEAVAEVFRHMGGNVIIARAKPGRRTAAGRLETVELEPGGHIAAKDFVFALGPWFPKSLPDVMANRLRISLGHVYYYGTPPGDNRFTWPNMPSYNVPGTTGWPALGPDNRGFRVRTGGRGQGDPDDQVRWIPESYHERPREILASTFPDMANAPLLETRACYYESTVSRNFLIDRYPGLVNAWLVGGGNAEGFKQGPTLGQYAAQRVMGTNDDPEFMESFKLAEEEFDAGGGRGGRGGGG